MSNYTTGPWIVNTDGEYCGARIDGPNGRSVAHAIQRDPHPTLGMGITQDEAIANARLIAAAPELLEACLAADWNSLDLPEFVRDKLTAAISKASGAKP